MKLPSVILFLLPVIAGALDVADIQNEDVADVGVPRRLDSYSSKSGKGGSYDSDSSKSGKGGSYDSYSSKSGKGGSYDSYSSKSGKGSSRRRLEEGPGLEDEEALYHLESRRLSYDSYSSKSGKGGSYDSYSSKSGKGSSRRRLTEEEGTVLEDEETFYHLQSRRLSKSGKGGSKRHLAEE